MASVGWQVGAGGVPIPVSSISRTTYGKKSGRPGASGKSRTALAGVFPLRDVHESNTSSSPKRTLAPLLVPKCANAPESADCVVLVSADGANFRVSRSVLAYASPVFQHLFSTLKTTQTLDAHSPASSSSSSSSVVSEADTLRMSNETLADGTPVIRMPESGKTLDALLRYLYPFPPSPSELITEQPCRLFLDEIKPVLLAAHKYSIHPILDEICGRLLSGLALPPSGEEDTFALRVYALACSVKKRSLAEAAAYEALRLRINGLFFPELEELPAVHYFWLLDYHRRCTVAVLDLLASKKVDKFDENDMEEKIQDVFDSCQECQAEKRRTCGSKSFWKEFLIAAEDEVRGRKLPRSQRIFTSEFISEALQSTIGCENCRKEMLTSWKMVSVSLNDEIKRCIHRVRR
ncbi:hypothetical protein ACEPAI_4086 [Sanghuangporus weigelae]